jgi:large subunit ribosomal protein L6
MFQPKEFFSARYLLIRVGYSYSVYLPVPNYVGIKISKKDRKLVMYSHSVEQVTTFAQCIYSLRSPSVYTGRGIRYKGCLPRRKLGKKDIRKGRFF